MATPRQQIIQLIEQGAIPVELTTDALEVSKIRPDAKAWRKFFDFLLLGIGSLAIAFAVMFFIAYNWSEIGRFAKFGLVEVLLALAILSYCKLDNQSLAAKSALLVATIFLGVLLALYGQTYQTGADPWQLFFTWSLMMLPWAFIGRLAALWIVWVVLINLSIVLYHQAFGGIFGFMLTAEREMFWLVFLLNSLALLVWEYLLCTQRWPWLSADWAIRLLAVGSGVPISLLVLYNIFETYEASIFPLLVWLIWLVAVYGFYRKKKHDLFMLAGGCLSFLVIVISFLAKHLLDEGHADTFLLLAILTIALGAGIAIWLRNIHREWQS